MVPRTDDVERFYKAAHLGLLVLDARSTRKRLSGVEATARWSAFAGDMNEWDRLDLCLRDAAVQFPVAFAPRVVFALEGLTDDEAFGESWQRPAGRLAWELINQPPPAPSSLGDLLRAAAAIWGLKRTEPPATQLDGLTVATRVQVTGAGALVAVALRLAEIEASNLIDQVTLISKDPGERQLFGLAAVFSKASGDGRILAPDDPAGPRAAGELRVGF
jgi:hypothetical protein